ncbi:RNA-guided endonuclease TnpB family protein [Peribacillus loiseleuriae]|uniref:RNA-guided endonuclease TnpB family protein n=1 Tax=Peribacillus loiseleuriae TaxID=1679170 RepID=UPI0037FB3D64
MVRKTVEQRNKELAEEGLRLHYYGLKLRSMATPKQLEKMVQFAGCARFTYNFYLNEKQEIYRDTGKTLNYGEFKKSFNCLKDHPEFLWLKQPDKFVLECAMEQVDDAFDRFLKGQNRYPKFKSKHNSKQSFSTKETNGNIKLDVEAQKIKLPKIGWVKVKFSKKQRKLFQENGFNGQIKGATVSIHSSGQVHISLKIEEIISLKKEVDWSSIPDEQIIGGDLGLTHFLIDSNGKKIDNPRYLKKYLYKLAKLQRQLKNKKKGSSNYKKLQKKIAKLHLKISNTRKDFLHKQSRKLVNENQVIVLEDLNVKGLIKNKKLARSIADVSWSTFVTFVSYKAAWDNKKVILIDRFFASSRQCNGCKEKNTLLSLSDRIWVCPNCGAEYDRDKNAAKNIKEEGIRMLLSLSKSA